MDEEEKKEGEDWRCSPRTERSSLLAPCRGRRMVSSVLSLGFLPYQPAGVPKGGLSVRMCALRPKIPEGSEWYV
jgi:hypothetical protein